MNPKLLIARTICHPIVGSVVAGVQRGRIRTRHCVISVNNDQVSASTKASIFWGLYESAERRFVMRYLAPHYDVIELGSSIGVISSHIVRRLESQRRLICVEANSLLLGTLEMNVRANSRGCSFSIVNRAVSYESNTPYATLALGEQVTTSKIVSVSPVTSRVQTVSATTLSQLVSEFGIDEYVLVSDIEGSEVGVIVEDGDALAKCRQIIIELHATSWAGRDHSVDDLCQQLTDRHGFILRDRLGPACVFDREPPCSTID